MPTSVANLSLRLNTRGVASALIICVVHCTDMSDICVPLYEFVCLQERARALRVLCLIGVVCAVAGSAMWLVSTKGHALSLKLVGSLPVSTAVLPEDHESQSSTTGSNAMLGNQNVAKMQ